MTPTQRAAMEQAIAALEGIQRYGLDTLSGRTDGPDDRGWQRAGVNEMTKRARLGIAPLRAALAQPAPPADVPMIEQKAVEPVGFVNRAAVNSAIIDRARGVGDTHTWSEKKTSFHSVPFYTSPQPAPHADVPMLTDEELREAFAQNLSDTYVCSRVWSAWSYGTMSEDDFSPASECDELLDSLVQAVRQKAGLK